MVVSNSSGMCVQPMEPEVSISNMMLGLTRADRALDIGVLEMSASAANAVGVMNALVRASVKPAQKRSRVKK